MTISAVCLLLGLSHLLFVLLTYICSLNINVQFFQSKQVLYITYDSLPSGNVLNSLLATNSGNVNLKLQLTTLLSRVVIPYEGLFHPLRPLFTLWRDYSVIWSDNAPLSYQ